MPVSRSHHRLPSADTGSKWDFEVPFVGASSGLPDPQSGLPSVVKEAINKRAFALARQTYPAIQTDLQALAGDLMDQGLSALRIAEAIAQAELRGGLPSSALGGASCAPDMVD